VPISTRLTHRPKGTLLTGTSGRRLPIVFCGRSRRPGPEVWSPWHCGRSLSRGPNICLILCTWAAHQFPWVWGNFSLSRTRPRLTSADDRSQRDEVLPKTTQDHRLLINRLTEHLHFFDTRQIATSQNTRTPYEERGSHNDYGACMGFTLQGWSRLNIARLRVCNQRICGKAVGIPTSPSLRHHTKDTSLSSAAITMRALLSVDSDGIGMRCPDRKVGYLSMLYRVRCTCFGEIKSGT
jgi:hypothetical protein